ncbi:MAG: hypothetical protein JWM80_4457 [Cyanobacteria bacterium RYN_339]|nr:hypothetical protein [Cyanobacteria bacterium RYN_339]
MAGGTVSNTGSASVGRATPVIPKTPEAGNQPDAATVAAPPAGGKLNGDGQATAGNAGISSFALPSAPPRKTPANPTPADENAPDCSEVDAMVNGCEVNVFNTEDEVQR